MYHFIFMLIYVLVGYKAKRGIVMREDKILRKLGNREGSGTFVIGKQVWLTGGGKEMEVGEPWHGGGG